jgi:hypothetical protein
VNKTQAHELLDRQKEQRNVTTLPSAIDYALFLTGDLGGNALEFSEGVDKSLQQKSPRCWQSKGYDVVAGTGRYYGSQAWFDIHYGLKEADE